MDDDAISHTKSGSDASSESEIEMTSFEDIVVTPRAQHHIKYIGDEESDDDEEQHGGDEEEGTRALLASRKERERELPFGRWWSQVQNIVWECAPTLLLTTIGILFTGELLDHVSKGRAMKQVDQLVIIIPVVLNLKGNLEMNLSARLGTAANVGELDEPKARKSLILGNLTLLQLQASVVSLVAACVAFILGLTIPKMSSASGASRAHSSSTANSTAAVAVPRMGKSLFYARRPRPPLPIDGIRKSGLPEFIMVVSCAMSAACLSSLILGSFMCTLIVFCLYFKRDPDNIAPPVASCLGDLITLSLLAIVSAVLINFIRTPLPFALAIVVLIFSAACGIATYRNPSVKPLITQGWSPLFGAMIISSGTGMVLDTFVHRYDGFGLLAVAICGLPGSVGSILVSRLSTSLHGAALSLPSIPSHSSALPQQAISHKLVMITLLLVTLPIQILFLSILRILGWLHLSFLSLALSLFFFACAVSISLFLALFLTNFLWSKNLDPDMYALPIHSALMDLVGQSLLVLCFEIASLMGASVRTRPID